MGVHKQYNLKSRKLLDTPPKKPTETLAKNNVEILTRKKCDIIIPKNTNTVSKAIQTNDPSTSQSRDVAHKLEIVNSNKT